MQTVTTIGLDIAKSVFQVHGVDAAGQVVIRRMPALTRRRAQGAREPKIAACGSLVMRPRLVPHGSDHIFCGT
jgi:transposase